MRLSLLFLLAVYTSLLAAPPSLNLPKEVSGEPASFIKVEANTPGKQVQWLALDAGLSVFPSDLLKNPKATVVVASKAGRYRLMAVTCLADELSEPVVCTVVIGNAPPTPTPGPGPTPPGPVPEGAFPSDGNRCLIVYESSKLGTYPKDTANILSSSEIRAYLNEHCLDGKSSKEWKFYDQDVPLLDVSEVWKKAVTSKREGLPWIYIGTKNGTVSQPLPATIAETLALLKKSMEG